MKTLYEEVESESDSKWRSDWLVRHNAKFDKVGRLIAYHGTHTKNLKSIKQNGFRSHSYFSLDPKYSKQIASTYHDVPESKVTVLEVHLPLDSVDFVMADIFSVRIIQYVETQ